MWPASTNVAWIPGATSTSLAVVDGREAGQRGLGVLGRVQRRVEVDVEVRRLGAQLGLGIARPGGRHRFDGRLDVFGRGGASMASTASAAGGASATSARPPGRARARRAVPAASATSPAAARATAASYSSASLRSSASTLSGWRFSQRASRLANSSWSLPESSRTSVASSIVPAVAWMRAAIAGLDQQRQQAAMVEMGVGQQDGVELVRVERERDAVADRFVRAALEHPAVDEDPGPVGGRGGTGSR